MPKEVVLFMDHDLADDVIYCFRHSTDAVPLFLDLIPPAHPFTARVSL